MNADKYNRSVRLTCPTCGCTTLEQIDDNESSETAVHCPSCDRTMSREELIRENGPAIEVAVDEMKKEVVDDLQKELRDMLKNAFRGSRYIKIK